ncbi:acyl-CoA dehydrogenase [Paenibacillus sp.]|uniref:acyl-CoA dehydrogenase n=1 Tax=Paenibacillus sp. TaxID=58172 RepID=UPI002D73B531|nr:acyl-CoA dehydrogenase [Paenibacillus sp.]HZG87725.1 acyl-CoA dehydrogenase [Paenibacillus sp.]
MFGEQRSAALRDASRRWEAAGVIDGEALSFIYEEKLFKLFVPEVYGGRMEPLPAALRLFEAAARLDGSFGWAVTIGSGGGFFAACLPPSSAERVFADPKSVIAGSGSPTGTAVRVDGGYIVNGSWAFCSGAPYATTFTAVAAVAGEDDALAFAFRPDQVDIVPTWRAFGLKATASHTIVAKDAFVPDAFAFRVDETPYRDEPIYRVPFLPFAESSFAAVAVGVARRLLEEAERWTDACADRWSAGGKTRLAFVRERLREAAAELDAQAERYYAAVERAWERHVGIGGSGGANEAGGGGGDDAWAEAGRRSKLAAAASLRAGAELFPILGIGVVMEDHPVNRAWRDLQTACQHTLLVDYGGNSIDTEM